jgi:AcrR family transcriptional regulator
MLEDSLSEDAELWSDVQPETRRRLLLAALEAFSANGYNAATTREIAQRCGMSSAAVYMHYRSKHDLLYEISRTGHDAVLRTVQDALDETSDPQDRLRVFMSSFVSWHAHHHTLARVIQYELRALPADRFDEIRGLRRRFETLLRKELVRGTEAGWFSIQDVDATALVLLSMGIDVARWYSPRARNPEDLGAAYGALALRIVGAAGTSEPSPE